MDVAAGCLAAERQDFGIAGSYVAHLLFGNPAVVLRHAPIRVALENSQPTCGLCQLLDGLHGGCAGADDPDALVGKIDPFLRPVVCVAGLAFERGDTWYVVRHGRRREDADCGDQKPCRTAAAILQRDLPASCVLAIVRSGDASVELYVPAQVEHVGDMVEIPLGLGLGSEMLAPVPRVEQRLRERVTVGPAFGIKPGTRVSIPIPRATDPAAGFECAHPKSELAQLVELIESRNARTDHDGVEIQMP